MKFHLYILIVVWYISVCSGNNESLTTNSLLSTLGDLNITNVTTTASSSAAETCPPQPITYCIWKSWWGFQKYYYYVCESLGIPCNVLIIVVMIYRRVEYACHWYVIVVALADLIYTISSLGTTFYPFVYFMNVWTCRAVYGCFSFGRALSSWAMLAISLERCLIIWFPFRARRISNLKVGFIVTTLLVLCIGGAIFPKNLYVIYKYQENPGLGMVHVCTVDPKMMESFKIYAMFETFFTVYVTPVVLNLIFNILMCASLLYAAKRRKSMTSGAQAELSSSKSPAEKKLTQMLITVSFMQTIFMLPMSIVLAMNQLEFFKTPYEQYLYIVLFYAFTLLSELNNFNNLFVYLYCNRAFRLAFVNMLMCRKANAQSSKYATTTMSMSTTAPPRYTASTRQDPRNGGESDNKNDKDL